MSAEYSYFYVKGIQRDVTKRRKKIMGNTSLREATGGSVYKKSNRKVGSSPPAAGQRMSTPRTAQKI